MPHPSRTLTAISFIGDFRTPDPVQRHVIRHRHPKIYTEPGVARALNVQPRSGAPLSRQRKL